MARRPALGTAVGAALLLAVVSLAVGAFAAPPAVASSAATAAPPPPSPCCAALAATGFTRAPGIPAVVIDTQGAGPPDRTKRVATLCSCGAHEVGVPGADGQPIEDWAGPIKLKNRGGTNTRE